MNKFTRNPPTRRALGLLTALVAALGLAGCEEEDNTTLLSPVQAVTTLLQQFDGSVEAELVLISTSVNPHQFVDTADNVRVRVPTGAGVFVHLMPAGNGRYTMDSSQNAELAYVDAGRYQFRFDLDDETAQQVSGGNFVAVMDAPSDAVTFNLTGPQFAGDSATVTWAPALYKGLIRVDDAQGNTVYQNFDFSTPQFQGDKWARLRVGGMDTLGVDVFQTPGDYTVHFCGVRSAQGFDDSLSAELGVLSGFLIGKCAAPRNVTVNP